MVNKGGSTTGFASGNQGEHLFALINKDRREQRGPQRPTPRQQSDRAMEFIEGFNNLTPAAKRVATAVAKAFITARKTSTQSRTAAAKAMVRTKWNTTPALRDHIHQKDLQVGLSAGTQALCDAGRELFSALEEAALASV